MTKAEIATLEKLQLQALKRYLKTPTSTPNHALYMDLGILPLEAEVDITQFKYLWKLLNSSNQANQILRTQLNLNTRESWTSKVLSKLAKYNLPCSPATIKRYTKKRWSSLVTDTVAREFLCNQIPTKAANSTKLTRMLRHKRVAKLEEYITHLSRRRASAIFRLRCKSTRAADNMCHTTNLPICDKCSLNLASDQHLYTNCPATQNLRQKFQINDLEAIYPPVDMPTLERVADFAIEAGLIPQI
jgi:hypothetical protein